MSAPPSYESVVQRLNNIVGPNPTPQHVMDAANTLPQSDIDVLAANATNLPQMSAEQKTVFAVGLSKETKSPQAVEHLKAAADDASSAYWNLTNMFTKLTADLAAIDSLNIPPSAGPFGPRLNTIHREFNETVGDSKVLAVRIAVYGRRFDQVIIPLCNDARYTVDQRLAKINEYIADADEFATDANNMSKRFTGLKDNFAAFTASFSGWAVDKEAADTERLKQARRELVDLQDKLSALESAFYVLSSFFVASLPATAMIASLSGPFAPLVTIAGLIAAALSFGAAVGLYFAIQNCKGNIRDKESEIQGLVDQIEKIKAARQQLTTLGDTSLTAFARNINVLGLVWQTAHGDAMRIKQWLQEGASEAYRPEYMEISLNHAVSIYALMADYLDRYANGVAFN